MLCVQAVQTQSADYNATHGGLARIQVTHAYAKPLILLSHTAMPTCNGKLAGTPQHRPLNVLVKSWAFAEWSPLCVQDIVDRTSAGCRDKPTMPETDPDL